MKWLLEHASGAIFGEPGIGKTSLVYGALKVLKRKGLFRRALIIAPLRPARLVWPAEQEKWTDFSGFKVAVLHGKGREEALASDADVCVTTYEHLDWLLGAEWTASFNNPKRRKLTFDVRAFRRHGFCTLVLDELSKVKNHASNRHKSVRAISDLFDRRWGLTGSPAANGLEGLFGQALVLDGGRTFGPYITHYHARYFLPHPAGFGWTLRRGAEAEIYERIRPLALRLEAKGLPALVEVPRRFDLPAEARRVYDALEEDLVAKIDGRTVLASSAGAATAKCRQVAEGAIYLDPEVRDLLSGRLPSSREWAELHDVKLDLLEDLLDELQGSPLLVAYDFRHGLERLKARFGKRKELLLDGELPVLGAGVTPRREARVADAWNAGAIPWLLGHPASVGHGLNLQGASARHVCFHSPTYDLELFDQFVRRVRRRGNESDTVFCHFLLARGTVDEDMFFALRAKERGQSAFFEALKARRGVRGR